MSVFKHIFFRSENKPRKSASHMILARGTFSHGWNDPSEIQIAKTSIVLDLVSGDEDLTQKLHYWNKRYYDFLPEHYALSQDQVSHISDIIGVDPGKYRELYAFWPRGINVDTYQQLFGKLQLYFVGSNPIADDLRGKYVIVWNDKFWNIPRGKSNVMVDIMNTHERSFHEFELVHSSVEQAWLYGIIIHERLCDERPPDTLSHYHERIQQFTKAAVDIPSFGFNYGLTDPEHKKAEYERLIAEKMEGLQALQKILHRAKEKPFHILKMV